MSGPLTQEPLSILQWMAPDMARSGLLRNEEWVTVHAERACAMFPNQGVRIAATLLAALDKRAIDYLEQAPVLALAASHGTSARRRSERAFIAHQFGPLAHRGVKLRDMLATYGMPLVMRKIAPFAVRPGTWKPIQRLAKLNPSTLSQIIPERPGAQARWLDRLRAFSAHLDHRRRDSDALFEWAAVAIADLDPELPLTGITEVADFVSEPARFNPRWSWAQAQAHSAKLHDDMDVAAFLARHDAKSLDQLIDYAPYPDEALAGAFSFVALRSARALVEEGRRMHHCVASYLRDVVKGFCRIYSVRREAKRIATIQIVDGGCVQAKGPCNRAVGAPVREAVKAFLARVELGEWAAVA